MGSPRFVATYPPPSWLVRNPQNCMDILVKNKLWCSPITSRGAYPVSFQEGWPRWSKYHKSSNFNMKAIYRYLSRQPMINVWTSHTWYSKNSVPFIDWNILAKANQEESTGFWQWATKHISTNMCGVGKWLYCWKIKTTSRAPGTTRMARRSSPCVHMSFH
jgi:hypothetical protein